MLWKKKQSSTSQPNRRTESARIRAREQVENSTNFRRNRTITGSSSARIMSSNELNADMSSPRALAHHLERHRRRLGVRLFIVIVALLSLYLVVSQLVANVTISAANGVELPSNLSAAYQKRIASYFVVHPTQRFFPSLERDALTAYLQVEYPEIKATSYSLTGTFGEAQAQVTLREPVVRWDIGSTREFVDDNGIVFAYNAFVTPSVQIVDKSGAGKANAQTGLVTSHRFLAFVGRVVGDAKSRGYTVTTATIPALTTRQLEVNVKGVKPYFKLSIDRSAGEQSEDIDRIIKYLKQKSLSAEYVDVRVQGKAFYK